MSESNPEAEHSSLRVNLRTKSINAAGVELFQNIDSRLWELSQVLNKQAIEMAEMRGDLKSVSDDVQQIKDVQARRMQFAQATLLSVIGAGLAALLNWAKSWTGLGSPTKH